MDTYFCGNFNQQKLFNKPTLIQFQDPNFQIENVHDLGEIILQSNKTQLYQWNFDIQIQETETSQQKIQVELIQLNQLQNKLQIEDQSHQEQQKINNNNQSENISQFKKNNINTQIKSLQSFQNNIIFHTNQEIQLFQNQSNSQIQVQQLHQLIKNIPLQFNLSQNEKILKISTGSQHALFLSMEGFVYSLGDHKNGKLGHAKQSFQNLNLNQPNIIEKLKKFRIQQISCGFYHNLALGYNRDGNQNSQQLYKNTIFSWGKGSDGCLGQGNSNDYYEPEIIVNFQKSDQLIKVICCSENSSFVLLQNGDIYSFGGNEYGELGHDNYFPCFQPSKVQINEAINNISPGKNHIFALSEKGNFYSWGSGQFGQLGNKNFQIKQKIPLILSGFASKYHIEMCINSIKMILYEDQTFIIMPSLETVKFERIQLKKQKQLSQSDSQKNQQEDQIQIQNKNRAQSDFIKKPNQQDEFSHLKQPVFKNIDEFLEKVKKQKKKTEYNIQLEQQDTQKSEQTLNRDKSNQFNKNYQNFSKLNIKELKKTLDQEKIVIQKTIEKIFYSKTEQQEKNKRLLTQDWEENILPYWETKKQSEEISFLVYQGIPPELRSEVWYRGVPNRLSITRDFFKVCLEKSKRFMNYLQQKKLKQLSPEIIQAIEEILIEQDLDKGHTQKLNKEDSLRMIENDLSRTFTHLGIFNENSPLLQNLREVLMAFVMARPDIGYLQGMSYICAILVLYMDKFRAFVIFTNMITAPSLMPFYQLEKEHVQQKLQIFKLIFNQTLPDLCLHFEKESIQPKMYVFEWMLCLYTKNLHLDTVCRIWDIMIVQTGPIFLYKVAIAILQQLQLQLLKEDIGGIMQILRQTDEIINENILIEQAKKVHIPNWILKEYQRISSNYIP